MKNIFLFILVIFLLSACKTPAPATTEIIKTVTVYRDTTITITIPGKDSVQILPVYLENGLINSELSFLNDDFSQSLAYVTDGKLFHRLTQRPQELKKVIPNAIRQSNATATKSIVKVLPGEKISGFLWFQIWIGRILLLLLLILLSWYIFKFLRK